MNLTKFSLEHKNALITGAAGMLGREHAIAILKSGGNVILSDVDDGKLQNLKLSLGEEFDKKKISAIVMNVAAEDSIVDASTQLDAINTRVDILINNAAINPKVSNHLSINSSRLENMNLQDWNFELAVGLTGAFLCSKTFGSKMAEDGKGGVILNIASDLSVIAPDQRLYLKEGIDSKDQTVKPVTYSVIKTGLIGLTRYLSTYWLAKGVRVNALSPGGVYENQDPEFVKKITTLIPLGRMASRDEYHSSIQYLCSDASSYMTGQNIIIDGGRSVW
jgi:NAD(P)-dependent dehydrogenase (short-subunit alcohol dehydrogenase family)